VSGPLSWALRHPPLAWLVELDDARAAAWDLDDPLLRGEVGRRAQWVVPRRGRHGGT
jgi:hypothetical protein